MSLFSKFTRRAQSLALALALLVPALSNPAPAVAEEPIVRDHRDPYARVQVVIKRIIVHDDTDWGSGEIAITFEVSSFTAACGSSGAECETTLLTGGLPEFSATDGMEKPFDRVIPSYGDSATDAAISPPFGIPLRPGQRYGISIAGYERDATVDDYLGELEAQIADQDGQVRFGTFTERGGLKYCKPFSDCSSALAKFSVEYEIRRARLPDLRPVNIKIYDLPGNSKKLVCSAIQNAETADAGAFEVAFKVDGVVPPGGRLTAGRLASGDAGELCTEIALPATGQHQLAAVVDEADGVLEYNERNNVYEQAYAAPKQATSSGPEAESTTSKPVASPEPGQADLTVSAVRVNGQPPDGKDDCKDGKNAVTVLVKNVGAANAGRFVVRLDADGNEVGKTTVDGLEAGKEHEVRIGSVQLKKGGHQLQAVADAERAVSEANEENNERTVTASCKDD